MEDTDHLKNEDVQDEITYVLCDEFHVTFDHLSKDDLIDKLNYSNIVVD